jgi:hypothetical protein
MLLVFAAAQADNGPPAAAKSSVKMTINAAGRAKRTFIVAIPHFAVPRAFGKILGNTSIFRRPLQRRPDRRGENLAE